MDLIVDGLFAAPSVLDDLRPHLGFELTGADADDAEWLVAGLELTQRLNEPYTAQIRLQTYDTLVEPSLMLGRAATLVIERGDQIRHEVGGIIERVEEGTGNEDELLATVTLVPALRALQLRKDSRIFQEMTIPEILQTVVEEGIGPFGRTLDLRLQHEYEVRDYSVQYQETDLDFVHRLMEENGIVYWFETEDGIETMVLADDSTYTDVDSLSNADGAIPMQTERMTSGEQEEITEFRRQSKAQPATVKTQVYDWLSPSASLAGESEVPPSRDGAEVGSTRGFYEHDLAHTPRRHGKQGPEPVSFDRQLQIRRKVHRCDAVRGRGRSTVTGLAPGRTFELLDHAQAELADRYLVVATEHSTGPSDLVDGIAGAYGNRFECIPASVAWKAERHHPRPRIPGIQTATVVGPPGEEIFTDEHGRIKVQFHWDQDGKLDDNSSCFVRVVQAWAGSGWGSMFLPRVGMEVAVTFVDGDPDRPVVTGCLYNGDNAPPYSVEDRTRSGIKTPSNEISVEDAAGREQLLLETSGVMKSKSVGNFETTVGGNQVTAVEKNKNVSVSGDCNVAVSGLEVSVTGLQISTATTTMTQDILNHALTMGLRGEWALVKDERFRTLKESIHQHRGEFGS
ncbi:MAG: type VI secretion system tip protein VgrG, partial [Deltaproteobacteria bacterium]|nr:type VI secretion system tip protein VgrG [Deltaproteobacteria bacterium]